MGLELFGDQAHKMPNVTGVVIPSGVDGEAVRRALLERHNIEIGTSFGPLHGKIWRIGTMGYNAREEAVRTTLRGAGSRVFRSSARPRRCAIPDALLVAIGGNATHPDNIRGTTEEQEAVAERAAHALLPLDRGTTGCW